jgi:hypothetical protein
LIAIFDINDLDFSSQTDNGSFSSPKLDFTEFVDNFDRTHLEIMGDLAKDTIGEKQTDLDNLLSDRQSYF